MTNWQTEVVIFSGILSLLIFLKGIHETYVKKNPYGLTRPLLFWGIFVWGDAVIFGIFWTLVSVAVLILKDWILFLLIISVFWVVRSFGEAIYWLNQQFSTINRNPPEKLMFYKLFKNDSVWFIYQIFWQSITVVSLIFTIYFAKIWF